MTRAEALAIKHPGVFRVFPNDPHSCLVTIRLNPGFVWGDGSHSQFRHKSTLLHQAVIDAIRPCDIEHCADCLHNAFVVADQLRWHQQREEQRARERERTMTEQERHAAHDEFWSREHAGRLD